MASVDDTRWMAQAVCTELDPDQFFPDDDKDLFGLARTKRVCVECPVRDACLQYAIDNHIWDGIWGGLTTPERHRLRRRVKDAQRRAG